MGLIAVRVVLPALIAIAGIVLLAFGHDDAASACER
jgi:hypothetical protein